MNARVQQSGKFSPASVAAKSKQRAMKRFDMALLLRSRLERAAATPTG
jgi:hypothetical protein